MPDFTITLTDAEAKALSVIAASPQEFIDNAIKNRCRISKEEIVASEIARIRAEGGTVSGTDDDIVMAANVETAAAREIRLAAERD